MALRSESKAELDKLESLAVIQNVDEPTSWMSSLVAVRKPNGDIRICIDPKLLNKALKRCYYQIPTLEDVLHQLSRAKVFTVADVRNGFWHVELDKASSELTTFGTSFGRYC